MVTAVLKIINSGGLDLLALSVQDSRVASLNWTEHTAKVSCA